jgi:uncharacterized protein (TIGR02466 family)
MSELLKLFEVSIWGSKIDVDNDSLSKHILYLEQTQQSDEGSTWGWKSGTLVDTIPCVTSLHTAIQTQIDLYAKQLALPQMKISSSWANVNNFKDFNMLHEHPGSVLSGVYYVNATIDQGPINFVNPADKISWAGFHHRLAYNHMNSEQWHLNSQTGTLYIFPAYLRHYVSPNSKRDSKRISVSFNTVYA